jgi:hypothetical protein
MLANIGHGILNTLIPQFAGVGRNIPIQTA